VRGPESSPRQVSDGSDGQFLAGHSAYRVVAARSAYHGRMAGHQSSAHAAHAAHAAHPQPADLAALLRSRGLRMTTQRQRVLETVREFGHATPEQLSSAIEGVDVTTVYRTLELLEDLGLVRHAHLGHGAPTYRPAEDNHVHIVCHRCGRVADAPADLVGELARRLREEHAFELDPAHFTVFGQCADCAGPLDEPLDAGTKTEHPAMTYT
jgi:Fur family transcriptional regulator, ferric uptake regulator